MFRLEKVFQNDDSVFIIFANLFKTFFLFIGFYLSIILENNTIYDLDNFNIYLKSEYLIYSILITFSYLFFSFFLNHSLIYHKNFISFLRQDVLNFFYSSISVIILFLILKLKFKISFFLIYQSIFLIFCLFVGSFFLNKIYTRLINKNIIQKNIMLVGNYEDINKMINAEVDKIYVFKCCIIKDIEKYNEKFLRSEIKFPIFKEEEDIRAILEYHALGQIWILTNNTKKENLTLSKIIKYSVDILIVDTKQQPNLKGKKLLSNQFEYEIYEMSRFHGFNFLIKIILDKFLSIIFLIISSPLILFSMITIYLEDGFPLLFTQNRTGWDGRRFKIYKLRTLRKEKFDKTIQVEKNDIRVLKFGKIIRRYSIDELPQFINVFLGDMSIVGPRPHMVEHDIKYSELFSNFLKRHKCNPGLTGWAQVNGLRGATPDPEAMKRRMEYDLYYLNNWTIFLDIYIIFKTFYALFKYKGD